MVLHFSSQLIGFNFSAAGTDIYGLWVLAGDLGYVIVFPQFLMAVHWPHRVNMEGSIAGAAVGIGILKTLRLFVFYQPVWAPK